MQNRLKSPVVWGAVLGSVYTQLEQLRQGEVNGWTVAMAVVTVLIAAFAALNNPTDRTGF